MTDRPAPPRPLRPARGEWREGWPIFRCHLAGSGPLAFNPSGSPGRFRPLRDERGEVIPTLYGADSLQGALSETILRNVPRAGPARHVLFDRAARYSYARLCARRRLRLAILHDPHVGRLGVGAAELGAGRPSEYPWTAAWAQAIHDDAPDLDGLIWVARHHNILRNGAFMLFGDRVGGGVLRIEGRSRPLVSGVGRRELARLLELSGIALIEG